MCEICLNQRKKDGHWTSGQKNKQGETDYKGICELEKELERHLCY